MRPLLLGAVIAICVGQVSAQWELLDSHVTADLRGVDSVGNGVAWASGSRGTVLRTEDAGFVWKLCTTPPGAEKLDLRGVQGFDSNTAIVMSSGTGDQARLYKTTDGCQTWRQVLSDPDKEGFWDALHFQDAQNGYLLGDPVDGSFTLFVTGDGGEHWTRQVNTAFQAQATEQGGFAASNSLVTEVDGWPLFVSGGTAGAFTYGKIVFLDCLDACLPEGDNHDGSKDRWVRSPIPVGKNTSSAGAFSVGGHAGKFESCRNDELLVAVGGDYQKPNDGEATAAFSTDGGEHWSVPKSSPQGFRSAVAYDARSGSWIAVGPSGTDISVDDGRSWKPLKPGFSEGPNVDRNWNALSLPYVVGPRGRIGILREGPAKGKPCSVKHGTFGKTVQ